MLLDVREAIKETGVREGLQIGREEGLKEGWKNGWKEGWRDGLEDVRTEIALKMIEEHAELSFISKVTGLPKTEIKELKKNS